MMGIERIERMVGSLFGVQRMRVHPLFFALLVGAYFAHVLSDALLLFLFVFLHELGHAIAARARGYEVEEVSLLPFGGVAKLGYTKLGFTPRDESIVAIAGPFVNLLCCGVLVLLFSINLIPITTYDASMQLNLWIAVFNLLPGLPLDGGRILRASRSRHVGFERATLEAYQVSIILSAILLFVGITSLFAGHAHVGMLILGFFLFVVAWRGRRDVRLETMRFLDAKRRITRPLERVHSLAVRRTVAIHDVVTQFAPDRYHVVYVLAEDGLVETIVEESELLDAVFEGKWMEPIWTIRGANPS